MHEKIPWMSPKCFSDRANIRSLSCLPKQPVTGRCEIIPSLQKACLWPLWVIDCHYNHFSNYYSHILICWNVILWVLDSVTFCGYKLLGPIRSSWSFQFRAYHSTLNLLVFKNLISHKKFQLNVTVKLIGISLLCWIKVCNSWWFWAIAHYLHWIFACQYPELNHS